jgi:hypothetical protein
MMFARSLSLIVLFLNGVAAGSLRATDNGDSLPLAAVSMFRLWAENHSKEYASEEHFMDRLKVWMNNNGTYKPIIIHIPQEREEQAPILDGERDMVSSWSL